MTWHLRWGDSVKAFEAQQKRSGITPTPMKTRPKLQVKDLAYYKAFNSLSHSRPYGYQAPCAIPVSEVLAYCQLLGIVDTERRAKYLSLVHELDDLWLEAWSKKNKNNA